MNVGHGRRATFSWIECGFRAEVASVRPVRRHFRRAILHCTLALPSLRRESHIVPKDKVITPSDKNLVLKRTTRICPGKSN